MKSIQTKIISVVVAFAVFIAVSLTVVSVASINILNKRDSNLLLEHLGRESAVSIDTMLISTEHSVRNIYYYAYDQLESLFGRLYSTTFRAEYMEKVSSLALSEAKNNDYVRSFYYRLTDAIKEDPRGFLYQRKGLSDYRELALTELSLYEQDDVEHVGWYYIPKDAKKGVWIGPYNNANLGSRMISYVEPVYVYGRFAGVIGMDIDINVVCNELEEITIYNTGSAVMFDIEDNILYEKAHADGLEKKSFGKGERALLSAAHSALESGHPVKYRSDKENMKLFATKLTNGMTLCVTAPLREINASRHNLLMFSIGFSILLSLAAFAITYFIIRSFLKPLNELTEASKQLSDGHFEVNLSYTKNDEIGQLSKTFGIMSASLKRYYDHFHNLAYTDSLTGLNNKAAFETTKDVIESELRMNRASFTIIVMDVNNLKIINDTIGHEKGDLLLKRVTACMRQTFVGFPLYRIGGDEFCTIINGSANPQNLIKQLQELTAEKSKEDFDLFQCPYQIAAGDATYEKRSDKSFDDVFNRADKAMYENKKKLKAQASSETLTERDS